MAADSVAMGRVNGLLAEATALMAEADRIVPLPTQRAAARQRVPSQRNAPSDRVYFIGATSTGLIKIGHSRYPVGRLKELRTGSPDLLVLLRTIPGGRVREAELHRRFREQRCHGEWFYASPELLRFIWEAI